MKVNPRRRAHGNLASKWPNQNCSTSIIQSPGESVTLFRNFEVVRQYTDHLFLLNGTVLPFKRQNSSDFNLPFLLEYIAGFDNSLCE
jgi:hypothetical protein